VFSGDRRELAAIFAGGAIGEAARTLLEGLAPTHAGHWPWITFSVNFVGCILLGYFVTRLQERLPITAYQRPLLGTGLCGGLTAFSTFQLELLRMLDHGDALLACSTRSRASPLGSWESRLAPRSCGGRG
jgi:CrcB protein